ncbi:carbonic anhydrase [Candidatus Nitrosocosmicus hydrocola]|uniref:carbonic anhydrase n=1 Tax=Candidatus Nitrosocosmicus hydrocola TaxID=1826872 RepID=UPI0015D05422|nr:carbonic anhydrase [Candidatus Nitrosocosmicus hydrocola]
MVNTNYQFQKYVLAIASIVVLLTIVPSSYAQQNMSQSGQQTNPEWPNIHENVITNFNPNATFPSINDTAYVHPFGIVIGNCHIGENVLVAPTAVCRGDEGTPLYIGDFSNLQDGVVIHGLITTLNGENLDDRRFSSNGDRLLGNDSRFDSGYSVYVGENVSLAHGVLIHGPAFVGDNTFVGMESMVFNAKIGNNVAIAVASTVTGGVEIPDNKFVPPGAVIITQEQADNLPDRVGSEYENINTAVVDVNQELAIGYPELNLQNPSALERESIMEEGMLETSLPAP